MMQYEAGRDLDALIAEKVMGMGSQWTVKQQPDGSFVPTGEVWHDCPEFSTDIAAAWLIVDKLSDMGYVVIVKADGLRDGTFNPRYTVLCGKQPRSDAPTAPLAICRAALLAQEATP